MEFLTSLQVQETPVRSLTRGGCSRWPTPKESTRLDDVHSHAILNIGQQVPLANQARWSVEGALSLMDANEIAVTILSAPGAANYAEDKEAVEIPGAST